MKAKTNQLAPSTAPALQPGDLVDERKTAVILDVEVGTLRNWRAQGKGPRFRKIGERMVRYHITDLAAFINGESGSEAGV
ncbi:helix-turn-helix transcriptional regulator [Rhodanobacter sp. Col0626]|uniref:helix-turn-helix transcriptional regulator n=1 Tax=Rhodanobacter sp. Col0626 TaxID=3415679 RepID=UPI003CE7ED4C